MRGSQKLRATLVLVVAATLWKIQAVLSVENRGVVEEHEDGQGFSLFAENLEVLRHENSRSAFQLANYDVEFQEHLGNFKILEDLLLAPVPLDRFKIQKNDSDASHTRVSLYFSQQPSQLVYLDVYSGQEKNGVATSLSFKVTIGDYYAKFYNRLYINFKSHEKERLYGLGEQFSNLDLKGRNYTIWTREQGVGRNKSDTLSQIIDILDPGTAGDYDYTYFPQSSFVSDSRYFFHLDQAGYSHFNFQPADRTEIFIQAPSFSSSVSWSISGYFVVKDTLLETVQTVSGILGRQPELPDWAISGAILGVQGGTSQMLRYVEEAQAHNVALSAMWIQDWSGKIQTTFGTRVFWNWRWNQTWYPNLDQEIKRLKEESNIRVLGYINPYLNNQGDIFKEGDRQGFFLRSKDDLNSTFVQDFGQFHCGTLDFWNQAAVNWYKDLIKENLLRFGLSGWMADFGEYTPVEAQTSNISAGQNVDASERHNLLPMLWAKLNREAVEELGLLNETMFWMRAGSAGASKYSTMLWPGDQNVDWSLSDGLPSTIIAALSAAMSGMGLSHFDVGGFTTITQVNLVRSEELLLRSAELAVFTPVMRTHEGNKPASNHQVYSSNSTWSSFARLTQIHRELFNYTKSIVAENSKDGTPVMRPLFLHYEEDPQSFDYPYQYLYGRDLLVAPVLEKSKNADVIQTKTVYLPPDETSWIHLWDHEATPIKGPKTVTVSSRLGYPPVFYRANSPWAPVFQKIRTLYGF